MRWRISLLLVLAACRTAAVREPAAPPPRPGPAGRIAVSASAQGAVAILDRAGLETIRRQVSERGAPGRPMPVVHDAARAVFYAGNFDGGLARLDEQGGSEAIDPGGAVSGLAISPGGALLAVATDRGLQLVDLERFGVAASVSTGAPARAPVWLDARTVVVAADRELVLVNAERAQVRSRVPLPGLVHGVVRGAARSIAVVESPPAVVVFDTGGRQVIGCADCGGAALLTERTVSVRLPAGEPAQLGQALLTPGENLLVVANGGPRHGPEAGRTVAGVDLLDGTLHWTSPGPPGASGVAWLGDDRVLVAGRRAAELVVLDATSGERVAIWPLPRGSAAGEALAAEPHGTALVLDEASGRVLRVSKAGVVMQSEPIGGGDLRASF